MKFGEVSIGGAYFKPSEHEHAAAFLVEVLDFKPQQPTKWGPKDAIYFNIDVFATQADIDAGTPTASFKNTSVQYAALVSNLKPLVGQATVVKLTKLPPRDGNQAAWAWQAVSEGVKEKVIAYAIKREQEIQEALKNVPDFE